MNGAAYYDFQSTARGLLTEADVDALSREMSPVYGRVLRAWLPARRDAAIYEVACGPGVMLRHLRNAGYTNLRGSDSAACQVKLAQASGLPVTQADSIQELEHSPDASWECIIAIDFIEHLPKDVLIRFLSLAGQKLKPGGCLILRAPNGDSPFVGRNLFNDITHVWAYTTVATRALLQMSGFDRVEFTDESAAMLRRWRWLKVPLMHLSQMLIRFLIRSGTREVIRWLSPSIYIAAWK